jgi:ribosome biogenesis GTPase A
MEKLDNRCCHYLNTHSEDLVMGRPKEGKSSLIQSLFKDNTPLGVPQSSYFMPLPHGQSSKSDVFI